MRWWCGYFRTLGAQDLAHLVPAAHKPQARTVTPTPAELERLTQLAPPDLRLVLLLTSQCGLRLTAALTLAPKHVVEGELRVPGKMSSEHRMPLPDAVRRAVAPLLGADPSTPFVALLAGRAFKRPQHHYHTLFAALKRKAGVRPEITFHDTRRAIARRVYQVTGDLRAAQALMGHRHLTTTLHYLREELPRVTLAQLNAAIAADAPEAP
jgi:integrase